MQNLLESASKLQKELSQAGIASAVIGGLAVAVWGEPRLTRDTDLKIKLGRDESRRLLDILGGDYTFLAKDPGEILQRMGFIFIRDATGVRLDLLLADTPFDEQVIDRARKIEVKDGLFLNICSPEDLILYKLISTRVRDREDVRGVYLRQRKSLDNSYILKWLRQFERSLDDSTLVREYKGLQKLGKG